MNRVVVDRTSCLLIVLAAFATRQAVRAQPAARFEQSAVLAYERAEAEASAAVKVARSRFGDLSLEVSTAYDRLVEVLAANGRGGAATTIALAERALAIKQTLLGSAQPALSVSLVNLGDALVAAGKHDRAIPILERAVTLQEGSGPTTIRLAEALDHLASALTAAGRYGAALDRLDRSLQTKESLTGTESVESAQTLERIGYALQRKGDYQSAADPIRRAAQIRQTLGPEHPDYALTMNLTAQQLWFEGHLQESRAASERALALAESTLRGDHPAVARALRFLAGTLSDLGDLEQSRALRERALAIVEREFGPSHYETAVYLNSAASSDLDLGDYAAARARFGRALEIFDAEFGDSHDYVATARFNLALVAAKLGDYLAARRQHARATEIWERTLGKHHPFVALALTELALAFRNQGRPAAALPLLERALAIQRSTLGAEHRDVARTLGALASAHLQLGHMVQAERQAALALRIWREQNEPDAPDFATALALNGELRLRLGSPADARRFYEEARVIRQRVFGSAHPASAEVRARLALTLAAMGDAPAALQNAVEAEAVSRDHLRLMLTNLPERLSLNYASNRPKGLDLILSLASSTPEAVVAGLDNTIRSRAMVLDEMAARRYSSRNDDTKIVSGFPSQTSARQRLANLLVRGPGEMATTRYTALVDEARRESEQAEQVLAEQSAEYRSEISRARIGLDEVVEALPSDSALVSFVRYDRSVFRTHATKPPSREGVRAELRVVPSYIAFILRPAAPPVAVPLGDARTIDALVSEWRRGIALAAEATAAADGSLMSSRASGGAIRRVVWDPAAIHLKGAARVFVVPDGTLSLLPFAALPVGEKSYLIERGPVIHYLSAERDLVRSSRPAFGRGLLALGGPSFNDLTAARTKATSASGRPSATAAIGLRGTGLCGGLQTVAFQPLGGTLQEVRDLAGLWTAGEAGELGSARLLVGSEATEGAFKKEAPFYRVIHLATHGFFMNGACAPTPTATRGVGGLARIGPQIRSVENPLLLSGLALAGANRRARVGPDGDDGILTAEEVAMLNLDGVEWAVLSACDTGVGEIRAGEGVFGLRRAFQVAGVRTVIMSLWPVEDRATRRWMKELYRGRFKNEMSTPGAVHAASLALLRDRRARGLSTSPFFWAAFVAAGDWR